MGGGDSLCPGGSPASEALSVARPGLWAREQVSEATVPPQKKAPPPPPVSLPKAPQAAAPGPGGPPRASVNMFSRKAGKVRPEVGAGLDNPCVLQPRQGLGPEWDCRGCPPPPVGEGCRAGWRGALARGRCQQRRAAKGCPAATRWDGRGSCGSSSAVGAGSGTPLTAASRHSREPSTLRGHPQPGRAPAHRPGACSRGPLCSTCSAPDPGAAVQTKPR